MKTHTFNDSDRNSETIAAETIDAAASQFASRVGIDGIETMDELDMHYQSAQGNAWVNHEEVAESLGGWAKVVAVE